MITIVDYGLGNIRAFLKVYRRLDIDARAPARSCDVLRPRITPCLLLRNGGPVKTVQFADGKYVGDPINAVKIFNEKEADDLIVLDTDASASGADPNVKLIGYLAVECRMPLCYGGGIKTVEQARTIIGLGVEKIAIEDSPHWRT